MPLRFPEYAICVIVLTVVVVASSSASAAYICCCRKINFYSGCLSKMIYPLLQNQNHNLQLTLLNPGFFGCVKTQGRGGVNSSCDHISR